MHILESDRFEKKGAMDLRILKKNERVFCMRFFEVNIDLFLSSCLTTSNY
jgi:hypothetical protein